MNKVRVIGESKNKKKRKLKELSRIFLYLRGEAIFFVVATHVAISLLVADINFCKTEILSPVIMGTWQLPSIWKFSILEIGRWPVPVFIFLAGYNLVRSPRSWKVIRNNCKKLIIPMVFWSLLAWSFSWRNGSNGWSVLYFLKLFFSGRTQLGYYFILLIIQCYIISMLLIPLIEKKPGLVISVLIILQLLTHTYDYIHLLGSLKIISSVQWIQNLGLFPEFLFPRFAVSFSLGIWASQNVKKFKDFTENYFGIIILLSIITIALVLIEVGSIFNFSYNVINLPMFEATSRSWGEWKITTAIWTIVSIFFTVAVFRRWQPFKKIFESYGKVSYQIFLIHGMVLNILILFCYKFFQNIHWYGIFGFCVIFSLTIVISMISIKTIRKWFPDKIRIIMLGS